VVPEVLRSKVKVFVELHRMNRQLQKQAVEREALARSEAARTAAEDAIRRADYLAEASQRAVDVAEHRRHHRWPCWTCACRRAGRRHGDPRHPKTRKAASGPAGMHPAPRGRWRRGVHAPCSAREFLPPTEVIRAASSSACLADCRPPRRNGHLPAAGRRRDPRRAGILLGKPAASSQADRADPRGGQPGLHRHGERRGSIPLVQEADRRKNEFLAMLAHELRNPLAPIRNAVHTSWPAPRCRPQAAWARDVIGRQVDHMARLIDDLLDVSRIVQGKVAVNMEPLLLSTLIERAVEASSPAPGRPASRS
jgi:hypothetical protein